MSVGGWPCRASFGRAKAGFLRGVGGIVERLAEVGQQLLDAVGGAAVAFDLAVPAVVGGVGGEGVLELAPCSQPGCVDGCGDELRAGQVEVALAGALGGEPQAVAEFEFSLEEVRLQPVDGFLGQGSGLQLRAAGPAMLAPGSRTAL
ncbi:hypothetical protein [Streptomyces sp. NBC_01800]|uniref:hypothetical protein n=1 Tax=Streptomyces sp. NBC_01800 TaxID=2975945 RepID=UPI002DD97520|nr:hypothetical protein [Streptomyces sp. NBC_01800]WSA73231.1 hypothetical protein OIE65_44070 [Streptomyces sp. NBC_01800]